MRKYHPTGAAAADPGLGPGRHRRADGRAYDLREDPGMTEEFDFRAVRRRPVADRAVHASSRAGWCTRSRPTPCGSTAGGRDARLLRRHRAVRRRSTTLAARRRPAARARRRSASGDDNPPELHLTGADCGRTAPRAGAGRLVLTHVPPWHDPQVMLREAEPSCDGPVELARAGATYEI